MRCAICDRGPLRSPPKRAHGDVVCHLCYGRTVVIRTAAVEHLGARTFYVSPLSGQNPLAPDAYVVKRFRIQPYLFRTTCNCPDFTHRGQVLGQPCKHVRLVTFLTRAAHGAARVPHGATFRLRLVESEVHRV